MYRIDSLHPDRLVCEACARAIGAVTLDPVIVPLGALPSADAAAEWPELAEAIRDHEGRCGSGAEEVQARGPGEAHHLIGFPEAK
jgi:hypothetical protein